MAGRGRPVVALVLTDDERETLQRWARRAKSSQALAQRSRIVLGCAAGKSNKEVAADEGVWPQTVSKWRRRFLEVRIDGLNDEPRPGGPRTIADEQIEAVHARTQGQTEVIAPVPEPPRRKSNKADNDDDDANPPPKADKYQRKANDSEPVAQWRGRMADDQIKEIYKQRAATAECVNALARNRGLQRMPVRGLARVRAVTYLFVLAHNLLRMITIAPQLMGLQGVSASAATEMAI